MKLGYILAPNVTFKTYLWFNFKISVKECYWFNLKKGKADILKSTTLIKMDNIFKVTIKSPNNILITDKNRF